MATLLPTSPFLAHSEPVRPAERGFSPNEELFMRCVVPEPLPDLDDPPDFLGDVERDLANSFASNIDLAGGFYDENSVR